jgi:hypothetical protein
MYKKLKHRLSIGKVYYYLGLMEMNAGKKDFAKKDFERAGELFKAVGAKQWESWTTKQFTDLNK